MLTRLVEGRYKIEPARPTQVDGRAASLFLASPSEEGRHAAFLVFEVEGRIMGFMLFAEQPITQQDVETLASTVRIGVDPPAVDSVEQEQEQEQESPAREVPNYVWSMLVVLVVASLPAAFGAATGYGSALESDQERAAGAASGAFSFTAMGMTLAAVGVAILLLQEMPSPSSVASAMAVVVLLMFAALYLFVAVATGFSVASLASLGARWGARGGRLTAALGAATAAGLGAMLVSILLGWLR